MYIYKNEQQLGPFSREEISEKLQLNEFNQEDLCWKEGWEEWRPLSIEFATKTPPPPPKKQIKPNKKRLVFGMLVGLFVIVAAGALIKLLEKKKVSTDRVLQSKNVAGKDLKEKLPNHGTKINEAPLNWEQTVKKINADIDKNDPKAMAIMSYWMAVGLQKVDIPKAIELANKSIQLGCPLGSFSLACIKNIKSKNRDDFKLAYPKIYEMADNGDPFAQYVIGCYYEFALGDVQRNDNVAGDWLNKAIDQNQLEAIDLGGLILARRFGRPQDAINLYLTAARRGFPHTMWIFSKAWCVGQGFIIPQVESTVWLERAAEANYGPAIYNYAKENYENKDKMRELLNKSADLNHSKALEEVGYNLLSKDSPSKDEEKGYSFIEKSVECETFNTTYLGADDTDSVKAQKENIEKHKKEIEEQRNQRLADAKKEEDKKSFIEYIGTKYGKGQDNSYQIVTPKLLSITPRKRAIDPSEINDKQVILDPLFGSVQRYWPDKDNLYFKVSYDSYTQGDPIVSHYKATVSVGGKLASTNEIAREDYGFYTSDNKSSVTLSEDQVSSFDSVYPVFKKWEKNFIDANEQTPTTKMIERPFVFIWNGSEAQLAIVSQTNLGDMLGEKMNAVFVDQIKYCLDQLPAIQSILKKAQSNMRGNIESSGSRIEQLTR
jgi:hypothetical protein